jgi:hypothetical protein
MGVFGSLAARAVTLSRISRPQSRSLFSTITVVPLEKKKPLGAPPILPMLTDLFELLAIFEVVRCDGCPNVTLKPALAR